MKLITKLKKNKKNISIIGLGYVGLPLAVGLSKYFNITGYDVNPNRIKELNKKIDITNEIKLNSKVLKQIDFTNEQIKLKNTDVFIVTVPTPIHKNNLPNLQSLKIASKMVGKYLKKKSIVVFESTVYPGCTEEFCIPIIEKISKLKANKDFYYGYSPERINPGDKKNSLENVVKVVSGSNKFAVKEISLIYKKIIKKGIHKAKNVKIAESAKIIENIQRDINIGFINELYLIFNKLNIDFREVMLAANTKWNFLDFKAGLVGGHCIGVDPYYLAYKAKLENCNSKILLAGREVNANMYKYILKNILHKVKNCNDPKILLLGQTFKENVPDLRNSQAIKIFDALKKKKIKVFTHEPNQTYTNKNLILDKIKKKKFDLVIVLVGHKQFKNNNFLYKILKNKPKIYDLFNKLNLN